MQEEYKVAKIILNKIDEKGPVNVNWNQEGWWTRIIVSALREAGIGKKAMINIETPGAATPKESK